MNIVLIGFMGSGKSTIGSILSKVFEVPLIETDDLVLKYSYRNSIDEIFKLDGKIAFRKLEKEVLKDLGGLNESIISTGGGFPSHLLINSNNKFIHLETSYASILKRLKIGDRPLYTDNKTFMELYYSRLSYYNKIPSRTIITDERSIEEVTNNIIKILNLK